MEIGNHEFVESKFELVHWSKIDELPKREDLVDGILVKSGLSILYGDTNVGKSFVAIDLCCRIATGQTWNKRQVDPGAVVYIASEGGIGVGERFKAWQIDNKINPKDADLYVVRTSIDFCNTTEDTREIITTISERNLKTSLFVIDTLSRAFGGGNENSSDDMGRFVSNCDRLRFATGAHVMVVHHIGKDGRKGPRGHNALRAAADTEIEVRRGEKGFLTVTVTKQRDLPGGESFGFHIVPIDNRSDQITAPSCVLREIGLGPMAQRGGGLSAKNEAALDALKSFIFQGDQSTSDSDGWIRLVDFRKHLAGVKIINKASNDRQQWKRILNGLSDAGEIEVDGDRLRLTR